jgi:hypothetical protein
MIKDFHPERAGFGLLLAGMILVTFKKLEQKNLAADEIYKTAYDRGNEDGYDQGYADRQSEQPTRPVVVPMPVARCLNCQSESPPVAVERR